MHWKGSTMHRTGDCGGQYHALGSTMHWMGDCGGQYHALGTMEGIRLSEVEGGKRNGLRWTESESERLRWRWGCGRRFRTGGVDSDEV